MTPVPFFWQAVAAVTLLLFAVAFAFAAMANFLRQLRKMDSDHFERLISERTAGFRDGIDYASGYGAYGRVLKEGGPPDPLRKPTPPESAGPRG